MRRVYQESIVRFLCSLLVLLLLVRALGKPPGDFGLAAWSTLRTVGLAVLFALPGALLFGVPAGLYPAGMLGRILPIPVLVAAAVPAVVLTQAVRPAGRELLSALIAGPWLAWAIRDGLAAAAGRSRPVLARACAGRVLQETGNLVVATVSLQALFGGLPAGTAAGMAGGWLGLALPALVAHLLGDLLVAEARETAVPPRRPSRTWLTVGVLLVLVLPVVAASTFADAVRIDVSARLAAPGVGGHLLGTDMLGRDLLARLAAGTRTSLVIAVAATIMATVGGVLLAALGRAVGEKGAAILAPRVTAPSLLAAGLSSLGIVLLKRPSVLGIMLVLGIAAVPVMAYAFRRLFAELSARWVGAGLAFVMAQCLVGEAILSGMGLGVQPPVASLGNLGNLASYAKTAGHVLIPAAVLALGAGGFFLIGQALKEWTGEL